ncbi:hypothetical protein J2Z18_000055 [Paenibacillus lactis]|uniref:Uncharacterized protein n=1 Tax=Paenibacillus lactis TaxID=228574 RepID=A0ABS4F415_9BACL|nr:hypothetical protein [Paenibacillus lactis]
MESRALQALVMILLGLRFTVYSYRLRLEVTITGYGFHLRFGYATLCFSAARKLSD